MEQQWIKILPKCALFQKISPDELEKMIACLEPRLVRYEEKNSYVTLEGDPFNGVAMVLEGEVAVTRENAEGGRVIMTKLGVGDLFGEMIAFSEQRVWPATIVTTKAAAVMFIPTGKIVNSCAMQCSGHKQLIVNMLRIISQRALFLNKKIQYLSIKSLRARISLFLLEQYKKTGRTTFNLPLSRQECADFLHVSRPALSREMGRMRDEGLIEFYRQTVKIVKLAELKRLSSTAN